MLLLPTQKKCRKVSGLAGKCQTQALCTTHCVFFFGFFLKNKINIFFKNRLSVHIQWDFLSCTKKLLDIWHVYKKEKKGIVNMCKMIKEVQKVRNNEKNHIKHFRKCLKWECASPTMWVRVGKKNLTCVYGDFFVEQEGVFFIFQYPHMCGQGLKRERSATWSRNEAAQHQTEKRDDTPEPQEIREDKTKKGASRELWRSEWRGEKMKYQRTEIERVGREKKSKLCRDCEPGPNSIPLFQEVTVFRQKKKWSVLISDHLKSEPVM